MFVSRGAYITARSFKWFVANALSALSIMHSKIIFIETAVDNKGKNSPPPPPPANRNEWVKNLYVINFSNCGSS